ncbi:hypothetical protein VNI00_005228 [Paramarasmius palmivorus]|uniref:Uncharacterized protein n=1 Tax=Paramarasmius palmivorus TaxID=297713 RepID=A0AAW0DES8_9AGAR
MDPLVVGEVAAAPANSDEPSLVHDLIVDILSMVVWERMESGNGVIDILLLDRARTARDFVCNSFAFPGGVPEIINAVAPYVRLLIVNTSVHGGILHALRTNVFPALDTMEAPYYFLMDADWTVQFHARLRQTTRVCDLVRSAVCETRSSLERADIVDCWPVLRRLCVQCKWGVPDLGLRPFSLLHLRTVEELAVVLYNRPWEVNLEHFLVELEIPASVEVVVILPSRYHRRVHELYEGLTFHSKAVIPIYGDPGVNVYAGDPKLAYLCNLTRVVPALPQEEKYWELLRAFVSVREQHPLVFHGGSSLVRSK